MLKRDRQALLDDLGDQRLEAGSDSVMAIMIGMCTYMAMLFLVGPWLVLLLSSDKDVRLALWVLIPLPFSLVSGFWYRHQNEQRRIAFSKDGFEFVNRSVTIFSIKWVEIQNIKKFRQTLTITKIGGTGVRVVMPQVKSSRNKSWFDAILASYLPPDDAKARAKKLAKGSLIFSLICLFSTVAMGRPRMMKPDQESPFILMDYFHVGAWAIAATGTVIGLVGIFGFLEVLGTERSKKVEPEPANAFKYRVEKNFGWLEPVELQPGRKYVYFEPNQLKKALRSQRLGLIGFLAFILVAMLALFVLLLVDPRSRTLALSLVTVSSLLIVALAMSLAPGYLRFASGAHFVDDELMVEGDQLVVHNISGIKKYNWNTRQSTGEVTKIQGTLAPFSRIEWVGAKPDRYMIDRRYLIEG